MDGGFIILGNTLSYGFGSEDAWLLRTTASGDTIWTTTYGRSGRDHGQSFEETTDGGYIITGWTLSYGEGNRQVWLVKTAPDPMNLKKQGYNFISGIHLSQNYPNPFNPSTTIAFDLPKSSDVTLKIFNILGEEVTILVSNRLSAGSYSYEWDASNLASGVYLYRLQAGDYVKTRKMVLMR